MADALSIAASGLAAQGLRLSASAGNIANISTTGRVPDAASPASSVYKPVHVSQAALFTGNGAGAGVRAQVTEDADGFSVSFDPTDPSANADGLIAVPNIDLTQELVDIMQTKALFKANLAVIKAHEQMAGDLLDTIA